MEGTSACADEVVCFLTTSLKNVFLALFTLLSDIGSSDELSFFKLGRIQSVCCCVLRALSMQAYAMRAYMYHQ